MKILIVKLSAFGDIVHALPVLPLIKKALPKGEIYWVLDSRFLELLEGNPYLSGTIPLSIKDLKKSKDIKTFLNVCREARAMRQLGFDIAIDIQGNIKSGVITWLSGAPLRFGFDGRAVREKGNMLFTNRKIGLEGEDKHIFQKSMRVVQGALQISMVKEPFFPSIHPGDELKRRVKGKIEMDDEGTRVAIHHGTTWETKRLSSAKWSRIMEDAFAEFGKRALTFYLTWGNREELSVAEKIAEEVKGKGEVIITPALTIRELAAFYSLMDLVIAPDTGPLHLAAAAGGKTLSFFRATRGERNAPMGPGHRFIQAEVDCTACLKKRCKDMHLCEESLKSEYFIRLMGELLPQKNS